MFVGTDLVYNDTVEKGCGNQVFDYCQVIELKPKPKPSPEKRTPDTDEKSIEEKPKPAARRLPSPAREARKVKQTDRDKVRKQNSEINDVRRSNISANAVEEEKLDKLAKAGSLVSNHVQRHGVLNKGSKSVRSDKSKDGRSPSPAPSPAPRYSNSLSSPRTSPRERLNHRSISPSPNREHKKTLRSISMSSASEASSGGESQPSSRPTSGVPGLEIPRSETRTLSHASGKLQRPNVGSDSENEETPRGRTFLYSSRISKNFERKIVIIYLPFSLNICFGCSKEPSH